MIRRTFLSLFAAIPGLGSIIPAIANSDRLVKLRDISRHIRDANWVHYRDASFLTTSSGLHWIGGAATWLLSWYTLETYHYSDANVKRVIAEGL